MREGDGRNARNELALKHGWKPISHPTPVRTESWEHERARFSIDYFPMTDRIICTILGVPLVNENVGGNIGLEKNYLDISKKLAYVTKTQPDAHRLYKD